MEKYQTKTQLLLEILLTEVKDELALSEQRINALLKRNDFETAKDEMEVNDIIKDKKRNIESLIEIEENSHCNRASIIQIGFINGEGESKITKDYVSASF